MPTRLCVASCHCERVFLAKLRTISRIDLLDANNPILPTIAICGINACHAQNAAFK